MCLCFATNVPPAHTSFLPPPPRHSGEGGESIYDGGLPFKDEVHTRLKFTHRGLLAMANENRPNSNTSQFFFTLDACEHLKASERARPVPACLLFLFWGWWW